jgi:signal transduction histidine kinase
MIANLFDNELKHLPAACTVIVRIQVSVDSVSLVFEDDGPGFSPEVMPQLFERRVKGRESNGHGLGLAFIDAVARAHGGAVTACNRGSGGAQVTVSLPLTSGENMIQSAAVTHGVN